MKPKWQKLASLTQEICTLWFQFFGTVFAYKGYRFKNIFDFTTAGDWDCVAAVERLPALHFSVDFYFLVPWDHGFHCGTLKLLEVH